MALTSYKTYLMYKASGSSSTYTKLVDIKEYPDLGSAPDTLDATTLSDPQKMYENDILDPGSLEFTANYSLEDYEKLKALEGVETEFSVWLGASTSSNIRTPSGEWGKFDFKGKLSVWKKGAAVSAIQEMGFAIAPTSEIVQSATAS